MQVEGHFRRKAGATGARVSNAYVTYPEQGDNPEKFGLIPHEVIERHLLIIKA